MKIGEKQKITKPLYMPHGLKNPKTKKPLTKPIPTNTNRTQMDNHLSKTNKIIISIPYIYTSAEEEDRKLTDLLQHLVQNTYAIYVNLFNVGIGNECVHRMINFMFLFFVLFECLI